MTPSSFPRGDDAFAWPQQQQQRAIRGSAAAAFYTHVASIAHSQVRATTPVFGAAPTFAPSSPHLAAGPSHAGPGFFLDAATTSATSTVASPTTATGSTSASSAPTTTESTAAKPWDRTLIALTLPAIIHTRSADIPHPRDPRRARQLERERAEFRNRWITGNVEIRRPDGDSESRVPVIVGDNGRTGNAGLEGVEASGGGGGGSSSEEGEKARSSSSSNGNEGRKEALSSSNDNEGRKEALSSSNDNEGREEAQSSGSERQSKARSSSSGSDGREEAQSSGCDGRDEAQSSGCERRDEAQSSGRERREEAQSSGGEGRERSNSGSHGGSAAVDEAAGARANVVTVGEAEGLPALSQHSRSDGKRSDDLRTHGFTAAATRTHVKNDSVECKESTSNKAIQEDTSDISSKKLSGGASAETIKKLEPTQPAIRSKNPDISSSAASTSIPELLDEDVGGNRNVPFLGKKSRPTITLHLSSHGATDSKKDNQQIHPATEIRVADSSVSDDENSVNDTAKKCTSKRHCEPDACTAKRPRIIEDLTCVEGTMFGKLDLSKNPQPAPEPSPVKKQKREEISEDELSSDASKNALHKKGDVTTVEATKKRRMRGKFRQLFGKTPTLSEIEEENELMTETLPRKRRKESRLSLDSGVSLGELNSERTSASPDAELREMRAHIETPLPAEHDASIAIKSEEKDSDDDPFARSMPLLDSFPLQGIGNETEDAISATQPDSSTTCEDKSEANLGGKLKILITPIDTVGIDSFAPMSLEIDIADGSLVSTTSTTELSIEAKSSNDENDDHEDLSKLLQMDVKRDFHITQQGNTISIQEEVDARIIPSRVATADGDVEVESRVTDIAAVSAEGNAVTSQTRLESQDLDDKTISIATVLRFNDKIGDSKNSQRQTLVSTSLLTSETRNSDQTPMNVPLVTCNYEFKFEDSYQRNLISSATEDVYSQKPSTSVNLAPKLEKTAIKTELPDVGESQKVLADVEKIKKELSDFDDIVKKELPDEENPASVEERENRESTETVESQTPSPAAIISTEREKNPRIPVPNIRVLHHSELGSRWCPTPIAVNNSIPSIVEAPKIPQAQEIPYQSPPVNPTTQIPVPINAKAPHPVNEIHYLHFLVMNTLPATTSNYPNSQSKDLNPHNNTPQAQPMRNPSVQQGTTSNATSSSSATINCQPNAPNTNPAQFNINDLVCVVIKRLEVLNKYVECFRLGPSINSVVKLRKLFCDQKFFLNRELQVVYEILGTNNHSVVVPWIFRHYPVFVRPEDRCLTIERILNILAWNDFPAPIYATQTQGQMQGVPAPPPVAHRQPSTIPSRRPENPPNSWNSTISVAQNLQPATTAVSRRPENPPNSWNSTINVPQNVQPFNIPRNIQPSASAPQPEFTRPQTRPKAPPKQKVIKFTKAQLKKLNEQIAAYQEIYKRQLADNYMRRVAAQRAILQRATREMSLQEKLKRTASRGMDQWLMPMAVPPAPLETNSVNKQPELRQSPGTLSQQQNQANVAQRRLHPPVSTFVPPSTNNSGFGGSQLEAQLTNTALNLQTTTRASPYRIQPTIPVPVENLNTQQRQSPLSAGNFVSQDPKFTANQTVVPVSVQDIHFQQQTRRSPATVSTQISTSQNSINGSRRTPDEMENLGAQIDQRRSLSSSSQQNPPKMMVRINLPNTAATMDNGLRLSPAASSANSTRNFIAPAGANCCGTWTSISTHMDNTVSNIQPQDSPSATRVQQIEQSNQRNIPVPVDDNIGASPQQQCSSAAMDYEITLEDLIRYNLENTVSADDIRDQPESRLTPAAVAADSAEKLAPLVAANDSSTSTSIPTQIDNTDAPVQQQCSPGTTAVQQQCSPGATADLQIKLEEPTGSNHRDDYDDDDDSGDQFVLQLSPASTIEDTTIMDSVQCNNSTSIPQKSPASNQLSSLEELNFSINFASTNDNAEAELEPQTCPAAAQEIPANHREPVFLHSGKKTPISVISTNDHVILPELNPTTSTHQTAVETPTDRNRSVKLAKKQQEDGQCFVAPINGKTASGISEIPNGSTGNLRVADVLEALDTLPSTTKRKKSKSSASCDPADELESKSLTVDAGSDLKDPIATNDADETDVREKHSEVNNNCASFQNKDESTVLSGDSKSILAEVKSTDKQDTSNNESIVLCADTTSTSAEVKNTGEQDISNNESTVPCSDATSISLRVDSTNVQEIEYDQTAVSAASPVPVITIDDDEEEEEEAEDLELYILEDCESPEESKDAVTEALRESKVMLPESAEAARETESEEIVSSWEIKNETSEIFSILDVKSIPKDVFNNMGESDQVEGPPTPGAQETMASDNIDIKDEALNCSRCGKFSSVFCSQCRSASYCSTECHQIHWTEIHYLSCKPVPEEAPAQL